MCNCKCISNNNIADKTRKSQYKVTVDNKMKTKKSTYGLVIICWNYAYVGTSKCFFFSNRMDADCIVTVCTHYAIYSVYFNHTKILI